MLGGFPNTYFKIAPFGFDATVYDTDDLSITRGSSLTLLALPELLKTHLASEFSNLAFDWIQSSASELVFRAILMSAMENRLSLRPDASGQNSWRNTLAGYAGAHVGQVSDDSLKQLGRQALNAAGLFPEPALLDMTASQILSMLSEEQLAEGQGAAALSEEQCGDVVEATKVFTSGAHDDWPFDLMLYNTVFFRPETTELEPTDAIAALDTRLGHARYGRMGCIVAPASKPSADEAVCQFTGIYAAGSHKEKGRPTSSSAHRRRKAGRDGKKAFYAGVLEAAEAAAMLHDFNGNDLVAAALKVIGEAKGGVSEFAEDFSGIVADAPDALPLSLKSNLCVLNMDGNCFGALRGSAGDIAAYRRFSIYLDILKAGLLARILIWIADERNGMLVDGIARFETLLWGGDEFTFVLPAWKGWELATVIHQAVKDWKTLDGKNMTFATGLVFGPHKAPIRDLKGAAEDLAEMAKSAKPGAAWQAVAYESVDRVHFSPDQYRVDWLGEKVEGRRFSLLAEDAVSLPDVVKNILTATSRSALHKLYFDQKIMLAGASADTSLVSDQIDRIAPAMSNEALEAVKAGLLTEGDYPLLRFAQINLLLDYILPGTGRA